jgi:hypothetical protein
MVAELSRSRAGQRDLTSAPKFFEQQAEWLSHEQA